VGDECTVIASSTLSAFSSQSGVFSLPLPKLLNLRAQAFLLSAEFGREFRAEVFRLKHLANFDLGFRTRRI
jgi:hypothetical protein